MEYSGDPISFFQRNIDENKRIRLLNVYKGVPISNMATITNIGISAITIKTEKFQIVSLYRERETYIQSDITATTIKAKVQQIDFPNVQATLDTFDFPKGNIGARTQVRVETEEPVQGAVMTNEMRRPFTAELADISQDGLGVFIRERFFVPTSYRIEANLSVFLPLQAFYKGKGGLQRTSVSWEKDNEFANAPSNESRRLNPISGFLHEDSHIGKSQISPDFNLKVKEIELHGTVVNVRKDSERSRYRIGIRLQRGDPAKAVISQFISQRQSEIINEINAVYNLLSAINTK
jgi:hypothetical protein